MKVSNLSAAQLDIVHSNAGLSSYLKSLEKGRSETPRSWLYENVSADEVLSRWMKVLSSLKTGTESDVLIFNFETKQISKFGPQGEVPPVSQAIRVDGFRAQYQPGLKTTIDFRPLTEILDLPRKTVRYWGYDRIVDSMATRDTLSTNSGWPDFKRRSLVHDWSILKAKSGQAYDYPAIVLFRKYFGKLRAVWMYPMALNLLEFTATSPIQDIVKSSTSYVTPWLGFEDVKRVVTDKWRKHPFAFGGDTTAMDAHMQLGQLRLVGDMSSSLFQDPTSMLQSLLHVSAIDLVVGPDKIIRDQQHGIASGSGWTQLSETLFQIGMFDAYIRSRNLELTVHDGMGIGDDYVWFFDEKPSADDIVSFWQANGLPGKEEKQSNEDNSVTFLQRLFIKGLFSRDDSTILGGVYPTIRALNTLIYPEKFHNPKDWNSDMFAVRSFMILENTVDHPLFEQFVKFVVAGNTHLREFAKMKSSEQNAAMRKSRSLPGLNPSYNQEKRMKPLSSFSSIQYAKEL